MTGFGYCPQCGRERISDLRYCTQCRFDFTAVKLSPSGGVTSLTPEPTKTPPTAPEPSAAIPMLTGIAWLVGAAAIGYLAFLQLEYSGLGFADADEARGLALWNGVTAAITAYFGAMAIVAPSRGRMGGAVIWAAINVVWGGYQVSQGLTHGVFLLALVAFSLAGVLALVAWSQLRQQAKAPSG